MSRHSYVESPIGFDVVAEYTEEGSRELRSVLRLYPSDRDGNPHELVRLLCFLLDALAVRDAEGLPAADWVEIGADDDDEPDLYAEAYAAGYSDALDHADDEQVEFHHAKSYEAGFRDGSAAAFELAAEAEEFFTEDDEEDEEDDDEGGYYEDGEGDLMFDPLMPTENCFTRRRRT